MLRVGMTNPPYILEHLEAMGEILSHPRVYAFLHVPVQSGSDAVLTDMRREYCRDDFRRVASVLRERVQGGVTIATDVICGFPTETPEDFLETLSLIEEFKFRARLQILRGVPVFFHLVILISFFLFPTYKPILFLSPLFPRCSSNFKYVSD